MELQQTLRGTGVALVTPFDEKGNIDFDALGKVIDFVISNGVEYLVSLGTTGEAATLEKNEKVDVLNYTFSHVAGRVPVIVGAGGNYTTHVISELETLPIDNAVAVLSAAPYYNKPSQEGLFAHYKALAAASPKPLILYNVPGRTGRNMEPATTLQLANEVENIVGIKEAGNSIMQVMQLMRDKPKDFLIISGDDDLVMPELACGIDGVISVAANCFPKQFSDMIRAGLNNDFATARSIHFQLLEGYGLLFAENNPAGVKAFLAELGLIKNYLRLPLVPLTEGYNNKAKTYLQKLS